MAATTSAQIAMAPEARGSQAAAGGGAGSGAAARDLDLVKTSSYGMDPVRTGQTGTDLVKTSSHPMDPMELVNKTGSHHMELVKTGSYSMDESNADCESKEADMCRDATFISDSVPRNAVALAGQSSASRPKAVALRYHSEPCDLPALSGQSGRLSMMSFVTWPRIARRTREQMRERSHSSSLLRLTIGGSVMLVREGGNGKLSTVFNIANGVIGTGLLVVPNAFRICGWLAAVVFVAMAALASGTSVLIARCMARADELVPEEQRKGEPVDWPLIGQAALGIPGRLLVKGVWATALYLKTVFCLVLNGTNLGILFPQVASAWLIGASGLAVFITLYLPSQILEYFSFMGIAVTLLIAAAVLTSGFALPEKPQVSEYMTFQPGSLVTVATTALFCCVVHSAVPSIYSAMSEEAKPAFGRVSAASFGFALTVYVSVGVAGYFFFAGSTQANVAQNIALDLDMEPIPDIGFLRLLLAALIVVKTQVTFPLFCWPFLRAAEAALPPKGFAANSSGVLLKVCFLISTTLPGILLAKQMQALVSLTGAICATSTAVVFPAAFYAVLFRDQLRRWQLALLALLFFSGIYLQVAGTYRAALKIAGAD